MPSSSPGLSWMSCVTLDELLCPSCILFLHVYSKGATGRRTALKTSGVKTHRVPSMSLPARTHRALGFLGHLPSKALMDRVPLTGLPKTRDVFLLLGSAPFFYKGPVDHTPLSPNGPPRRTSSRSL